MLSFYYANLSEFVQVIRIAFWTNRKVIDLARCRGNEICFANKNYIIISLYIDFTRRSTLDQPFPLVVRLSIINTRSCRKTWLHELPGIPVTHDTIRTAINYLEVYTHIHTRAHTHARLSIKSRNSETKRETICDLAYYIVP